MYVSLEGWVQTKQGTGQTGADLLVPAPPRPVFSSPGRPRENMVAVNMVLAEYQNTLK